MGERKDNSSSTDNAKSQEVERFSCDVCRNLEDACDDCADAFQNHQDYLYDIWVLEPIYNK